MIQYRDGHLFNVLIGSVVRIELPWTKTLNSSKRWILVWAVYDTRLVSDFYYLKKKKEKNHVRGIRNKNMYYYFSNKKLLNFKLQMVYCSVGYWILFQYCFGSIVFETTQAWVTRALVFDLTIPECVHEKNIRPSVSNG